MRLYRFSTFCNGIELGAIVGDSETVERAHAICGLPPANFATAPIIAGRTIPAGHNIANFPIDYGKQEIAKRAAEVGILCYSIMPTQARQVLGFPGFP